MWREKKRKTNLHEYVGADDNHGGVVKYHEPSDIERSSVSHEKRSYVFNE